MRIVDSPIWPVVASYVFIGAAVYALVIEVDAMPYVLGSMVALVNWRIARLEQTLRAERSDRGSGGGEGDQRTGPAQAGVG